MPVSRDRLSRPIDISTLLPSARQRVNLVVDEPGLRTVGLGLSPVRTESQSSDLLSFQASRRATATGPGRVGYGHGRNSQGTIVGRENITPITARRGRGGVRLRNRNSVLPSWYPRTPLRDITAVARAVERRRARLNDGEGTQATEQQTDNNPSTSALAEDNISLKTPGPATVRSKPKFFSSSKVWRIVSQIADEKDSGSESLTPQRKLLNSIDKVRDAWMEDQQKLQNMPGVKKAAMKAERERKMRTLRTMR